MTKKGKSTTVQLLGANCHHGTNSTLVPAAASATASNSMFAVANGTLLTLKEPEAKTFCFFLFFFKIADMSKARIILASEATTGVVSVFTLLEKLPQRRNEDPSISHNFRCDSNVKVHCKAKGATPEKCYYG